MPVLIIGNVVPAYFRSALLFFAFAAESETTFSSFEDDRKRIMVLVRIVVVELSSAKS